MMAYDKLLNILRQIVQKKKYQSFNELKLNAVFQNASSEGSSQFYRLGQDGNYYDVEAGSEDQYQSLYFMDPKGDYRLVYPEDTDQRVLYTQDRNGQFQAINPGEETQDQQLFMKEANGEYLPIIDDDDDGDGHHYDNYDNEGEYSQDQYDEGNNGDGFNGRSGRGDGYPGEFTPFSKKRYPSSNQIGRFDDELLEDEDKQSLYYLDEQDNYVKYTGDPVIDAIDELYYEDASGNFVPLHEGIYQSLPEIEQGGSQQEQQSLNSLVPIYLQDKRGNPSVIEPETQVFDDDVIFYENPSSQGLLSELPLDSLESSKPDLFYKNRYGRYYQIAPGKESKHKVIFTLDPEGNYQEVSHQELEGMEEDPNQLYFRGSNHRFYRIPDSQNDYYQFSYIRDPENPENFLLWNAHRSDKNHPMNIADQIYTKDSTGRYLAHDMLMPIPEEDIYYRSKDGFMKRAPNNEISDRLDTQSTPYSRKSYQQGDTPNNFSRQVSNLSQQTGNPLQSPRERESGRGVADGLAVRGQRGSRNGRDGRDGKNGRNGRNGRDGRNGKIVPVVNPSDCFYYGWDGQLHQVDPQDPEISRLPEKLFYKDPKGRIKRISKDNVLKNIQRRENEADRVGREIMEKINKMEEAAFDGDGEDSQPNSSRLQRVRSQRPEQNFETPLSKLDQDKHFMDQLHTIESEIHQKNQQLKDQMLRGNARALRFIVESVISKNELKNRVQSFQKMKENYQKSTRGDVLRYRRLRDLIHKIRDSYTSKKRQGMKKLIMNNLHRDPDFSISDVSKFRRTSKKLNNRGLYLAMRSLYGTKRDADRVEVINEMDMARGKQSYVSLAIILECFTRNRLLLSFKKVEVFSHYMCWRQQNLAIHRWQQSAISRRLEMRNRRRCLILEGVLKLKAKLRKLNKKKILLAFRGIALAPIKDLRERKFWDGLFKLISVIKKKKQDSKIDTLITFKILANARALNQSEMSLNKHSNSMFSKMNSNVRYSRRIRRNYNALRDKKFLVSENYDGEGSRASRNVYGGEGYYKEGSSKYGQSMHGGERRENQQGYEVRGGNGRVGVSGGVSQSGGMGVSQSGGDNGGTYFGSFTNMSRLFGGMGGGESQDHQEIHQEEVQGHYSESIRDDNTKRYSTYRKNDNVDSDNQVEIDRKQQRITRKNRGFGFF